MADDAGSFQRRLTMPPNPETSLVTLPEVVTGELAGNFGEISLFDLHADFKLGSASNSNSTSPWATVCEPAAQPSHADSPPRERFTRDPRNLSRARTEAFPARRTLTPLPTTPRTPTPSPASIRTPRMSLTSGRTLRITSPRTTLLSNPYQGRLLVWL
jgi:hypothetical protein